MSVDKRCIGVVYIDMLKFSLYEDMSMYCAYGSGKYEVFYGKYVDGVIDSVYAYKDNPVMLERMRMLVAFDEFDKSVDEELK